MLDGCRGRRMALGRERGAFGQKAVHAEHEHAGVPEEPARSQHRFGLSAVGLFDKALHGVGAVPGCGAGFDVAIACFGAGGGDAEGHQPTGSRSRGGDVDGGPVCRVGHDQMVGGEDMNDSVFAELALGEERCGCDGRGGIARHRFEQHASGGDTNLLRLFCDEKAILGIGNDDGRSVAGWIGDALQRFLERAQRPGEGKKLFRPRGARHRPQPCPLPAREDYRNNSVCHA